MYISVTFCHRKGGRKDVECLQIAFLFGHKCPHFSALRLLVKTAMLLEMIGIEMIQIAWTFIQNGNSHNFKGSRKKTDILQSR